MLNSHTSPRFFALALAFAGVSACVAVGMGAVASHTLTDALAISRVEKASAFQFYHTFALLIAVVLNHIRPSRLWRMAALLFGIGIFAFCGALYLAAFGVLASATTIAPFGGTAWMLGWLVLAAGGITPAFSRSSRPFPSE